MYNIILTNQFQKDIKFYKFKKKYTKIDEDLDLVILELERGNLIGDEISHLKLPNDESSYKVRVANTSANFGKSNGFRMIYYVIKNDKEIYLLTIYSKSDKENIKNEEINRLINLYCN